MRIPFMNRGPVYGLVFGICVGLLSLSISGLAGAGNEDNAKAYWQERYIELLDGVASAQRDLSEGKGAYAKAKQRNRLQGAYKTEIMDAIADAETRLARWQRELDSFPDEAHRAGVPPGWLREIDDRS